MSTPRNFHSFPPHIHFKHFAETLDSTLDGQPLTYSTSTQSEGITVLPIFWCDVHLLFPCARVHGRGGFDTRICPKPERAPRRRVLRAGLAWASWSLVSVYWARLIPSPISSRTRRRISFTTGLAQEVFQPCWTKVSNKLCLSHPPAALHKYKYYSVCDLLLGSSELTRRENQGILPWHPLVPPSSETSGWGRVSFQSPLRMRKFNHQGIFSPFLLPMMRPY